MTTAVKTIRPATKADVTVLAELVNYAGEGLPLYLWAGMAEADQTPWEVGRKRAAREEGSFSYRNAMVIEHDGKAAGCLIGYETTDEPEPIGDEVPAMFAPLQELENLAPDTWYVNVLAVLPDFRGHGLGSELMKLADETGRKLGKAGMSLIVSDANTGARRLYERCGYSEIASRPMVKEGWKNAGENWILMTKPF